MSAQSNAPIVIKKVKKVVAGGHHGGAWKVAIDFIPSVMRRFCAGLEIRPQGTGSRAILTSTDVRLGRSAPPPQDAGTPCAEVLNEL